MRMDPRVLTGARAGRGDAARGQQGSDVKVVNPGLYSRISALLRGRNLLPVSKERTPYDVVYVSRYSRHKVQYTSPEDEVNPRTGHKSKGRPIALQFDKCLFSIPKKFTPAQAADIVAFIKQHPNFGPGRDFWEQGELLNEALIRDTVHTVEKLAESQPMREAVLEYLSSADFIEEDAGVSGGLPPTVKDEDPEEDPEDEDDAGDEEETEQVLARAATAKPARRGPGRPRKIAPPVPQKTRTKRRY